MSVRILQGDCREVLKTLPDRSVHCCVTSPPYYRLRDYGVTGQMGLEETPDEFVAALVSVFREVRRVLRDDGTLWLNLGDSYSAGGNGDGAKDSKQQTNLGSLLPTAKRVAGFAPKQLLGIPWRVAFGLQADGWFLRQELIWAKPNPMPESVRDRCTKSHEQIFLFAKSGRPTVWRARDTLEWSHSPNQLERLPAPAEDDPAATVGRWMGFDYYYDQDAIAEPLGAASVARLSQAGLDEQAGSDRVPGKTNGPMKAVGRRAPGNKTHKSQSAYEEGDELLRTKAGLVAFAERERDKVAAGDLIGARNKRSVWTVATLPFKEAHFATFPPALIEPCVLAGCPEGGTILDPFGGAGTTGLVADRLGRDAVLIELNPEYASMARKRIVGESPLFAEIT